MPTKQKRINDLVLAGEDVTKAASSLVEHNRPDINARQMMQNKRITEENRINFDKIELDERLPYKVIKEAMSAKKTELHTFFVEEEDERGLKHVVQKTVHKVVPDHAMRLNAVKQWAALTGRDPRSETKIQINTGDGAQLLMMNVYAEIADMDDDDDALTQMNNIKRLQQQGRLNAKLLPPAEFKEI
jgi:hypothetical protein